MRHLILLALPLILVACKPQPPAARSYSKADYERDAKQTPEAIASPAASDYRNCFKFSNLQSKESSTLKQVFAQVENTCKTHFSIVSWDMNGLDKAGKVEETHAVNVSNFAPGDKKVVKAYVDSLTSPTPSNPNSCNCNCHIQPGLRSRNS